MMRKGGKKVVQAYFEGLYFKQQNERESVALIPAIHADGRGNKSASLQIITDEAAYQIGYDGMEVVMDRDQNQIAVGKSFFFSAGDPAGCGRGRRPCVWEAAL